MIGPRACRNRFGLPNNHTNTRRSDRILEFAQAGTLWVFDRGFYDFGFCDALIDKGIAWITRLKSNTVFTVQRVLLQTAEVRDQIGLLGEAQSRCRHPMRVIEVRFGRTWYRPVTLEMVFRSLYYFIQAYSKGEATDPVKYLAASENRDLGVAKRIRKKPPEALAPSALSLAGA